MIEEALLQYGVAGIFIIYLIYDKQVLMKKFSSKLDKNTDALNDLSKLIEVKL